MSVPLNAAVNLARKLAPREFILYQASSLSRHTYFVAINAITRFHQMCIPATQLNLQ